MATFFSSIIFYLFFMTFHYNSSYIISTTYLAYILLSNFYNAIFYYLIFKYSTIIVFLCALKFTVPNMHEKFVIFYVILFYIKKMSMHIRGQLNGQIKGLIKRLICKERNMSKYF